MANVPFTTLNEINVCPEFITLAKLTPDDYAIEPNSTKLDDFEPYTVSNKEIHGGKLADGETVNNFKPGINNPKCLKLVGEFNFGYRRILISSVAISLKILYTFPYW